MYEVFLHLTLHLLFYQEKHFNTNIIAYNFIYYK